MNQKRVDRMERVESVTGRVDDMAKDAVRQCEARLEEQRLRLSQLNDYLSEYAAGLGFAQGGQARAFALQNYRAFMARIEQTVDHQRQVVETIESELASLMAEARETSTRHRAVGKLRDRFQHQLDGEERKRDQRVSDAQAANRPGNDGFRGGFGGSH